MRKPRKEIAILAEFLGYGMAQLHENTVDFSVTPSQENNVRLYRAGYLDALARVSQAVADLYTPESATWLRNDVLSQEKRYFFALLTREEMHTLTWLSDHGYDGALLQFPSYDRTIKGITKLCYAGNALYEIVPLTELQAREWKDNVIDSNTGHVDESFLACNASESLTRKLWAVLDSIV
jgi:hypothetical protein